MRLRLTGFWPKYIRNAVALEVTDEAIQQAYDTFAADTASREQVTASHILVETEEEANAIIVELNDGADFAQLAQDKSTGPSGPNGGLLALSDVGRWCQPSKMRPSTCHLGQSFGQASADTVWLACDQGHRKEHSTGTFTGSDERSACCKYFTAELRPHR